MSERSKAEEAIKGFLPGGEFLSVEILKDGRKTIFLAHRRDGSTVADSYDHPISDELIGDSAWSFAQGLIRASEEMDCGEEREHESEGAK